MKMIEVSTLRRFGVFGMTAAAAFSLNACVTTPATVAVVPTPPVVATAPTVVETTPAPAVVATAPTVVQTVPAPARVAPRGLPDARIAAIVMDVNRSEIREAQLALAHSRNPRVRAYAQHIIRDHSMLNNTLVQVARAEGIRPMEGRMAMRMRSNDQLQYRQLASLSGPAFDRAYMDAQINAHRRAINAMDRRLVPDAHSPQLRVALQQARPEMVAHLQTAERIRATL